MVLAAAHLVFPICLLVVTAEVKVGTLSGSCQQHNILEEKNQPSLQVPPKRSPDKDFVPLISSSALCPTTHAFCPQQLLNSVRGRMSKNDTLDYKE